MENNPRLRVEAEKDGRRKASPGAALPPQRTRLSEFDRQDTARCEENDKRKAKLGGEDVKRDEDKWGEKARVRGRWRIGRRGPI